MLPDRCIFMYLLMLLNSELLQIFYAYKRAIFHYVKPFTLEYYVDINNVPTLFQNKIPLNELLKSMIHILTRIIR